MAEKIEIGPARTALAKKKASPDREITGMRRVMAILAEFDPDGAERIAEYAAARTRTRIVLVPRISDIE